MNQRMSTIRSPQRMRREQRVDAILTHARDSFCANGYEATAVAEIAARMGIVEGTIYKYFSTKRDLLLCVLEHWYEEMFGDYRRDLSTVNGARNRLHLLIWRHLKSVHDYPLLCRLMFREVHSGKDYRGSRLHAMNRRYTQMLLTVIHDGVQEGTFRQNTPALLLRDMVYGGIEHHAWNFVCGRGALPIDTLADEITAILCNGIEQQSDPASTAPTHIPHPLSKPHVIDKAPSARHRSRPTHKKH
jgi:AcrR family transcriptional regulator